MKIEDIIISKSFAETSPSKWKLAKCRTYYEANGEFAREIVLNTKKVLIDGYVAYLIAKEKGLTDVSVRCDWKYQPEKEKTYIYGRHKQHGKRYVWEATKNTLNMDKLAIGSTAIVDTKYGKSSIVVGKIKISQKPPTIFKMRKVLAVE